MKLNNSNKLRSNKLFNNTSLFNNKKNVTNLVQGKFFSNKKKQTNNFNGNFSNILNNFKLKKFGGQYDKDFDGIKNKYDCNKNNSMKQDSQLYLKKNPQKNIFYTTPNKDSKKIFINNAKYLKGQTNEDIELIANLITHEEMHNVIYDEMGMRSSSGLDSVTNLPIPDKNNNIINKKSAGLPNTPTGAKLDSTQGLNQRIENKEDAYEKWKGEIKNHDKVESHYNDFSKRTNMFSDHENNDDLS